MKDWKGWVIGVLVTLLLGVAGAYGSALTTQQVQLDTRVNTLERQAAREEERSRQVKEALEEIKQQLAKLLERELSGPKH